jgi:hypothetical protein
LADATGAGIPVSTLQRSGRNYRWSDEELMAALTQAIDHLGHGRFPSGGEYTRYREEVLEGEAGKLTPRRVPAMNGFQRRFGGWRKTEAFYREWLEAQGKAEEGSMP